MNDTHQAEASSSWRPWLGDPFRVAVFMAWLSGGLLALLVGIGGSVDTDRAASILSVLSIALGLWIFWTHGGRRISAVGIWGYAFALFVGFAGTYTLTTTDGIPPGLLGALIAAYFGQVCMWGFFWSSPTDMAAQRPWVAEPTVIRWGMLVGAILLVMSSLLSGRVGDSVNTLVDAAAFVAAVLLSSCLLLRRAGLGGLWRLALPAAAFGVYAFVIFSGFGRLTLGTLGLAISVLVCKRLPARSTKALILLASVPALIILARTRVEFTAGLNPDQLPSVSGFESVVGPLTWSGELLVRRGELPLGWGSTFWASAASMVPRELWEAKPVGFGAVLVPILTPELVGTSQSDLALSQSEWLYAFGLPGLALTVPALGWFVLTVDRWLAAASTRAIDTRPQLLTLVAAAVVAAGLADLLWGGTFTFVSRAAPRLFIVGVLLLLSRLGWDKGPPSARWSTR